MTLRAPSKTENFSISFKTGSQLLRFSLSEHFVLHQLLLLIIIIIIEGDEVMTFNSGTFGMERQLIIG
jgi:hypothetical protein